MGEPPTVRVLVVAGHDPSGAGLTADRAALADLGVDARFVTTAHTDQDARGVRSIGAREPRAWLTEALAAAKDGIDALKFGLLPGASHVAAAAELVRTLRSRLGEGLIVVVDPVLSASSGGRFLDELGVESMRGELFVQGVIATPNLPEAAELCGSSLAQLVESLDERVEAAQILLGLGARAVILKGGHGHEDPVRDLIAAARDASDEFEWIAHPRIPHGKIRGSGCRYATRLAARLAQGHSLLDAARDAAAHVATEIERATRAGDR